jgi:hypothetical protein
MASVNIGSFHHSAKKYTLGEIGLGSEVGVWTENTDEAGILSPVKEISYQSILRHLF